jgi:hypothetical protein
MSIDEELSFEVKDSVGCLVLGIEPRTLHILSKYLDCFKLIRKLGGPEVLLSGRVPA